MKTLDITLTEASGTQTRLAAPDVATALTVAAINADEGEVEISKGDRPLARLRKGRSGEGEFWEVNP